MTRMSNLSIIAIAALAGCAAPATASGGPATVLKAPSLARFMRESLNVPFSFAMMATASQRPHRVVKAASLLGDAAHHLADWADPPRVSPQGREVFYAYAANLGHHVRRLEFATQHRDAEATADSLEQIRQTCNRCHNFFRPASRISPDVYVDFSIHDRVAVDLPGGD